MKILLLLSSAILVHALGEPCLVSNNRLDPNSHKFTSDCGPTEYCSDVVSLPGNATTPAGNVSLPIAGLSKQAHKRHLHKKSSVQNVFLAGEASNTTKTTLQKAVASATCQSKGCRRDEYPFGYGQNDILPPRCAKEEFCPDEEDECQPLVPLGGACQLNRDDECEPPSNATILASENNFNGAICLSYTCMYADVQLGGACKIDNTVYSGYLPDGSQFTDIVSRDNCMSTLYCSSDSLRCEQRLDVDRPCSSDNQCLSGNCDVTNICVSPPETPQPIATYVKVLVALGIITFMTGMIFGLWKFHQRSRTRKRQVLKEYWTEQLAYRHSIMSMHHAALLSETKSETDSHMGEKRQRRRRAKDDDGISSIGSVWFSETSSETSARRKRMRASTTRH